jgi:hypothetical protein
VVPFDKENHVSRELFIEMADVNSMVDYQPAQEQKRVKKGQQ